MAAPGRALPDAPHHMTDGRRPEAAGDVPESVAV